LKTGSKIDINEANIQAAEECERRVWNLVAKADRSFVIETVLSSDKYKPILRTALAKGFLVLFVYVVLDSVEEAIGRVADRVHHGGHDVPVEKIRSRWPRSLANLPWFWKQASRSLVYFNGSSVPEPVLMAERRGPEISFMLDPPALWALRSLLPRWKSRSKKR
jgi:predicted ABC-type ATPase